MCLSNIRINELTEEEIQLALNAHMSNTEFISGFTTQIFNDGMTKGIDAKELQEWLSNPEEYQKELENLAVYYYITNSSVFQLYDMAETLPTLNYKITVEEKNDKYEENKLEIKKLMKRVKHKQLTRDLITQTIAAGTLCGIWVGNKKKPHLFVFNDLEYVFPAYIGNDGEWVLWLDLSWFDKMTDFQKEFMFESLSPHVTEADYNKYDANPNEVRYLELPVERTVCLRTHTLYRNQRLGIPWGTQSFFDNIHKDKLKDLEKSISNKVINSVAVLQLGNDEFTDDKLRGKKQKTYRGVKTALEKNNVDGITVIGIPHWSKLDFPDIKTDGLDPKKFESINEDLNTASNGIMNIINGKSNFSTGKLSMDIMYKKIAVLLEQIEEQVYQKLINLSLRKKDQDNYSIAYDKHAPLTTKEQVAILENLQNSYGFSLKAVIDKIDGVDFEQYIEDSIYEQEVLNLPSRIQPYASAYTATGDNRSTGAPEVDDITNPSTEGAKTTDGNNVPKPSNE